MVQGTGPLYCCTPEAAKEEVRVTRFSTGEWATTLAAFSCSAWPTWRAIMPTLQVEIKGGGGQLPCRLAAQRPEARGDEKQDEQGGGAHPLPTATPAPTRPQRPMRDRET